MNPRRVLRPDPQPAYALLALILSIFAFLAWRHVRALSVVLFVIAAVLLVRFVRGVVTDLQISKVGLRTTARVIRVEERRSNERNMPSRMWRVTFAFTDVAGVEHEQSVDEYDEETAGRYRAPGAVVNIAYHPEHPEMFRWLD